MLLTEERVLEVVRRGPGTTTTIRQGLGLDPDKKTSNRIAYLLKKLQRQGLVTSQGTGRQTRWVSFKRPCEEKAAPLPSALVVVHSEWDPLVVARATPGSIS